ncbi:MAG: hypothetical protein BroJett012_07130 [Betaproteobacteria bacterium]|nr:MAG: hypothetical protein BroJett012_07130 [Betaproteobacteria bacterium]
MMTRIEHPYSLRIAALLMWGADFSLLRRLVWFAWASTNPDIAGMSEVAARRSILRGLVGKRKWSMAIAAGTYLVAMQQGKRILVLALVLSFVVVARIVGFIVGMVS